MPRSRDTEMQDKLKQMREIEESNAVEEYKNKLAFERAAARASELDILKKSLYREDEKGNKHSLWDEVINKANQVTSEATEGYNSEWRICMQKLVAMLFLFTQALNGTIDVNIRHPLKQLVIDGLILGLKDKVMNKVPSEISLPSLEHNVTFSEDNKLQIAELIRSDKVTNKETLAIAVDETGRRTLAKERQQFEDAFKKGIVRWLDDNGYEPHPTEESQFVNKENPQQILDKATFDQIKNDETHGLQSFLTEESDLVFTPRM